MCAPRFAGKGIGEDAHCEPRPVVGVKGHGRSEGAEHGSVQLPPLVGPLACQHRALTRSRGPWRPLETSVISLADQKASFQNEHLKQLKPLEQDEERVFESLGRAIPQPAAALRCRSR